MGLFGSPFRRKLRKRGGCYMNKVRFNIKGKRSVDLIASDGENLLEAARRAGVMIDSPCSGNVTCGKCKVKIESGQVRTEKSSIFLKQKWPRDRTFM
jgi:Uncharacterized metal-binding protein